eukprot:scaffold10623_cov139-Isochrysis_galbana.AAC.5
MGLAWARARCPLAFKSQEGWGWYGMPRVEEMAARALRGLVCAFFCWCCARECPHAPNDVARRETPKRICVKG